MAVTAVTAEEAEAAMVTAAEERAVADPVAVVEMAGAGWGSEAAEKAEEAAVATETAVAAMAEADSAAEEVVAAE